MDDLEKVTHETYVAYDTMWFTVVHAILSLDDYGDVVDQFEKFKAAWQKRQHANVLMQDVLYPVHKDLLKQDPIRFDALARMVEARKDKT